MISITGSTRAGVLVAQAAAATVKRVAQELGGKSPNVILPDADLARAVPAGVAAAFRNVGQSCSAPTRMAPTHWAAHPNLPKPEYDLKKAAAMLDQAGWVKGPDGIRVKNGVRLSFSNSTTTGNQLRAQTQQLIADDFKKIGVEMLIKNLVAAVLWADFWKNSEFDSLMRAG